MSEPTKKNYKVLVTAYARVLVIGAKSEKEAMGWATDEVSFGSLDHNETSIEGEVHGPERLALARKFAHVVVDEENEA